jgi:hypothetical protein
MRMKDWILTVSSAVSLLLLAMVVSFLILDHGSWMGRDFAVTAPSSGSGGSIYGVSLFDGNLFLCLFKTRRPCSWGGSYDSDNEFTLGFMSSGWLNSQEGRTWRHFGGFGVVHASPNDLFMPFRSGRILMLPGWVPIVILLVMPLASLRAWLRKRRRGNRLVDGLCLNCGYDLRASRERCPECRKSVPVEGSVDFVT